jgi:Tat protein secretion system quality control protein TatD with DNase activity
VRHVAEYLADLKEVPLATLAATTTRNFKTLFQIPH